MATPKKPSDEKLDGTDFNLFEAITAIDRKDYGYWDRLTSEQQRKFVPYMMIYWISTVKNSGAVASYYLRSTEYHANKHLFNEAVQQHPKLQWLMLCAASPGLGKQQHQWISHLSAKVTALKEAAKLKDVKEYLAKMYTKADDATITEAATSYVSGQRKSVYLAQHYPHLKLDDIATLNAITSDQEIQEHKSANEY